MYPEIGISIFWSSEIGDFVFFVLEFGRNLAEGPRFYGETLVSSSDFLQTNALTRDYSQVRMAADRETSIVSVERVREYLRLELEPPHHCETLICKLIDQVKDDELYIYIYEFDLSTHFK